jgi:hypothetical protein
MTDKLRGLLPNKEILNYNRIILEECDCDLCKKVKNIWK